MLQLHIVKVVTVLFHRFMMYSKVPPKEELIPEYLMLWLIRPEFGRFVYWASEGSAYEFLNYDNLADYLIRFLTLEYNVQLEIFI